MARRWFLESITAQGLLARTVLDPLPFRVGRAAGLELLLASDSVSKEHAEIVRDGRELRVRDLGSKNGTFVNRALIQESPLREGDIIHFADIEFRIGVSAAEEAPPEAPPGALVIFWQSNLVGPVEGIYTETTEFVFASPASPPFPPIVRSAKLRGRWVPLAGASADVFARAAEDGTQLEVSFDWIVELWSDGIDDDEAVVGLLRRGVGLFSLGQEGEALLYVRN